jgi:hypothetical protein
MSVVTRLSPRSAGYVIAGLAATAFMLGGRIAVGEPAAGAPAPVEVVSEGSAGPDMAPMVDPMEDVAESGLVADADVAPMVPPMEDVAE